MSSVDCLKRKYVSIKYHTLKVKPSRRN